MNNNIIKKKILLENTDFNILLNLNIYFKSRF